MPDSEVEIEESRHAKEGYRRSDVLGTVDLRPSGGTEADGDVMCISCSRTSGRLRYEQ